VAGNIRDKEFQKFKETPAGKTAVRVCVDSDTPVPIIPSNAGTTKHFNGTATASPSDIPAVAGGNIRTVFMTVPKQAGAAGVLISFDGGVEYTEIQERGSIIWPILGSVTQIKVKTSVGSFKYEIILNRDIP